MSSYVISKSDYVKAAGTVAGMASALDLWLYDYQAGRKSEPEDFYNRFCEVFTMNSLSVQEQYDDPEPETDSNGYQQEFNKAFQAAKSKIFSKSDGAKILLYKLSDFFSSAVYQIENYNYMFKTKMYFDGIIAEATKKILRRQYGESDCWGSFEI